LQVNIKDQVGFYRKRMYFNVTILIYLLIYGSILLWVITQRIV